MKPSFKGLETGASQRREKTMSETIIPGLAAKHAIVTPECRFNRTVVGALEEALERLECEYLICTRLPDNKGATYHFVLTIERPETGPKEISSDPRGWFTDDSFGEEGA